jgi:hypothetical protein
MFIWNNIEFEYKGKSIRQKPDFEFMNGLENRLNTSLYSLFSKVGEGNLPISTAIKIINYVLSCNGVKDSPQEILEELGNGSEVIVIVAKILQSCLPIPNKKSDGKKQQTPME